MLRLFLLSLTCCAIVTFGAITYTDNVQLIGSDGNINYYTITTVATTTTTTQPPLADYIEYLIDETGGTNVAGLVDDTSGNGYDGIPTGLTWVPATNGAKGNWFSLNDGGDYILSTNLPVVDYAMLYREKGNGSRAWGLITPDYIGSLYVTTNATSIEWGDGSSANDNYIGMAFAYTNDQTSADWQSLWFETMTNYGLPVWYYNNRATYSNATMLVTFASTYGDLSGTTNNLARTGVPVNMSIVNGIGVFNGSSAKVTMSEETRYDYDDTDPFSILAWIYVSSFGAGDTIVSKAESTGNQNGYWFRLQSVSNLEFYVIKDFSPDQYFYVTSPADSLVVDTWHHVAMTKATGTAAATVKLYIDGIEQVVTIGHDTLVSGILNNIRLVLGSRATGQYFDGRMDEVVVSSGVLASNTIFSIYSEGAPE